MTVFYQCPVCGADVDDDNEWSKKHPIRHCPNGTPYHENCGLESHYSYCGSCRVDSIVDFWKRTEIQKDIQRIDQILSTRIFEEENKGNYLVRSALTEVLICLRDLVGKMEIISSKCQVDLEIKFTDDVNITVFPEMEASYNSYCRNHAKDIRLLIIIMRDALCHQYLANSYITPNDSRLSFTALYGIDQNTLRDVNGLTSDYKDDVCFVIGIHKIYLVRHIIRFINEVKSNISPYIRLDRPSL